MTDWEIIQAFLIFIWALIGYVLNPIAIFVFWLSVSAGLYALVKRFIRRRA